MLVECEEEIDGLRYDLGLKEFGVLTVSIGEGAAGQPQPPNNGGKERTRTSKHGTTRH